MARPRRCSLAAVLLCCSGAVRLGAQEISSGWQSHALPFRPLNVASVGRSLWVCGTDASIAVSNDDGRDWKVVRHEVNGPVLLNIAFADAKFGYAAGSNGLLLITSDGGGTWTTQTTTGETILQVSFADPRHGLIRTPGGLMFTVDGGAHWSPVPMQDLGAEALQRFRYSFALAALDGEHMLIALKDGPTQSNRQAFLVTADGGASWKFRDGPDAILYSFVTLEGKVWAVGQETVDRKDRGGHDAPVALYSSDGERWNRTRADLSVCQRQGCTLCTNRGCLAANGTLADVFQEHVGLRQFPHNGDLTPAWAATDAAICTAGSGLQCASMKPVKRARGSVGLPAAPLFSQPPLAGAADSHGPLCLLGGIEPSLLASHGHGSYELHMTFQVAPNGTVESVEVTGAPLPEIADGVRRRVRQWVFEPTIVDGAARRATATANVRVDVSSR